MRTKKPKVTNGKKAGRLRQERAKYSVMDTLAAYSFRTFGMPMNDEAHAKQRIESARDDIAKKAEMLVVTSTTTRWTHRRVVDDDAYRELCEAQREHRNAMLAFEDVKRIKRIARGTCEEKK